MREKTPLKKSIGVDVYNRPIKVAYIIPSTEDTNTQLILDAIFYESYTRWGTSEDFGVLFGSHI
jgi:hypothetical protein